VGKRFLVKLKENGEQEQKQEQEKEKEKGHKELEFEAELGVAEGLGIWAKSFGAVCKRPPPSPPSRSGMLRRPRQGKQHATAAPPLTAGTVVTTVVTVTGWGWARF
jgi:hypothetical protein